MWDRVKLEIIPKKKLQKNGPYHTPSPEYLNTFPTPRNMKYTKPNYCWTKKLRKPQLHLVFLLPKKPSEVLEKKVKSKGFSDLPSNQPRIMT